MDCNGLQWIAMDCNGLQWIAIDCRLHHLTRMHIEQAEVMQAHHVLVLRWATDEEGGSAGGSAAGSGAQGGQAGGGGGGERRVRATLYSGHLRSRREIEDAPTSGAELAKLLHSASRGVGGVTKGSKNWK
jgi:hypothetical protein